MVSAKVRGHGDDAAFLQLGNDSGHRAVEGRRPEEGQGPTAIGHNRAQLEVQLAACTADLPISEDGLGVDLAGQVDGQGIVYGDHVVVLGDGAGVDDVVGGGGARLQGCCGRTQSRGLLRREGK